MRYGGEAECRFQSDFSYVWLSHDNETHFAPAHDPSTGVRCVVAGRLCWPMHTWQRAERLPYEGGIANREMLDRYLRGGPGSVAPYNGAATIVIWDPRDRSVHFWTDQFGYHPAFIYTDALERPIVYTTFPDTIRADPAIDARSDIVSMAEFLRAWRVTPPHTYYERLKHAGVATYIRYELGGRPATRHEYWRPFENEFFPSPETAAEALAGALRLAVGERTAVSSRTALFVSGGADSRVMLYAAQCPEKVWGVNLYEQPTQESATAKALCERVGATYIGFARDNDYYPRMQQANVRWSGAMWCTEDNHYLGVKEIIDKLGADLVMTACTTDWVFKGYGLEKSYHRVLGRNLPIKRFIDERVDGFLPNYPNPAPAQFAAAIDDRMSRWFDGTPRHLRSDLDRLLVEDRRIRPACYTVSVSGQIMYRTYPYDTFLADSRVAECYARVPARWKLNGEVWGAAAGMICTKASDIPDSNFGWAVDANVPSKLASFAKGWIKRRVARMPRSAAGIADHPPSYASWPDMGWYAIHSERLRNFWRQTPADHRALMESLLGADPWRTQLEDWSSQPHELMRILTLLQHWRLCETFDER